MNSTDNLLTQLGGREAIEKLSEHVLGKVREDPRIQNRLRDAEDAAVKQYLEELFHSLATNTDRPQPGLAELSHGRGITKYEVDAFLALLEASAVS